MTRPSRKTGRGLSFRVSIGDKITEKGGIPGYNKAINTNKEDFDMSAHIITNSNYAQEVLSSDKPVLLDFWAPWCAPCRMVLPIVEEIAGERDDIKVGKVNVDEEMALARQFRVMSIPTLVVIKDGKVVKKSTGALPKEEILELLK